MDNTFDDMSYLNWLSHIGVDHLHGNPGSGRYPYGSGEHRYQRADFNYDDYLDLKAKGVPEKEIAEHFNMSMQEVRDNRSIAKAYRVEENLRTVAELYNTGTTSPTEISRKTGIPEASVRTYIKKNQSTQDTTNAVFATADILKQSVDEKKVIDIGSGTELILNVSPTRYKSAIRALENAGYHTYSLYQDQLGSTKQQTTVQVLCAPDITKAQATKFMQNAEIGLPVIDVHSEDNGLTFYGIEHPKSIDSKRVMASYDATKDGLVELRRGVEDVSLGDNRYAQVRIAVDGTHYIKGMAVYSDNLPDGIDIRVNTNKKPGTPLISQEDPDHCCLKPMKRTKDGEIDYDNPFGAAIKQKDGVTVGQRHYVDENGKTQLSCINIINEEGDWSTWRKKSAAQMLSKQSIQLINQQLDIAKNAKENEFNEIMQVENPTVRKRLLMSFADECDSAAVDLAGAPFPRQASHVIVPIKSLRDDEIYAPNYRNGEKVILIRYPHGGPFEIPELTVNNRNKEAQSMIGSNARDAVGITQKTAGKLSGADFDGDSVLVIPNNNGQIFADKSSKFKELQDFDTKIYYKPGHVVSDDTKQREMGKITNLISDMTFKYAPAEDLIPAVKFSMVIIDSVKHNLDWQQAYKDYGIDKLKEKYRGNSSAGASTVVTRAKSPIYVDQRKLAKSSKEKGIIAGIDKLTGKYVYEPTGKHRKEAIKDENGKVIGYKEGKAKQDKLHKMEYVDDAFKLVGDPEDPKERSYASFANSLKSLANEARRIAVNTENMKRNSYAVKTYAKEVAELNRKLKDVKTNRPLERQAQMLANKRFFAAKNNSSIEYTKKELKRLKGECLAGARLSLGAKKPRFTITPKEWEAIEAGAVSSSTLSSIINSVDIDIIRNFTMPRASQRSQISYTQEALIRSMANRPGVTQADIAAALGISASTVNQVLHE